MEAEYIFTADDYGPIDFINDGICRGVQRGWINSVQVLVNVDDLSHLKSELVRLLQSVPQRETLDL